MLRTMFDELLQIFSYVGQKKKKIFSTLTSCAVIFGKILLLLIIYCLSVLIVEYLISFFSCTLKFVTQEFCLVFMKNDKRFFYFINNLY